MYVYLSFISGFNVGLEFFFGDSLAPDDKFAAAISVGIVRFTVVVPKGN